MPLPHQPGEFSGGVFVVDEFEDVGSPWEQEMQNGRTKLFAASARL